MKQKTGIIIIPGIVAILLFSGIEMVGVVSKNEPESSLITLDYDGYSEGINTIRFREDGTVAYTLRAERQLSYTSRETELHRPYVQVYQEGESYWNIVAETGRILPSSETNDGIAQIDFSGNVEVYEMDNFGNRTQISTDNLSIDPTNETLVTDDYVSIRSESLEQSAIGLHVDLNENIYTFEQDVRGRFTTERN